MHLEVGGRAPAAADGHLPCQKVAGPAQLSGPRHKLVSLWPAGPCSVARRFRGADVGWGRLQVPGCGGWAGLPGRRGAATGVQQAVAWDEERVRIAGHPEGRGVNQGDRGGSAVAVVPGAQAAGPRQGNRALSQLTRTVGRMPPLCGTPIRTGLLGRLREVDDGRGHYRGCRPGRRSAIGTPSNCLMAAIPSDPGQVVR